MKMRKQVDITSRIHDYDTIDDFINIRVQEIAKKTLLTKTPSAMTGCTIRLPKGELAAIDKLAGLLDVSRQELLFEIIGTGMDQAIKSFASNLEEADRATWSAEMVNLWTAFDEELEDQA
jgi:hypothetical protein